eukprot:s101_g20.t1
MLDRKWHFVPGAPAQPLSSAPGCVGGKAEGVGVLSTCPTRALANQWDSKIWGTARIQACAIHVQNQWVKLGVAYGYAKQCHTRATREATDSILEHLTERIVFQSRGMRMIGGDLNQDDPDALEQFAVWRQHGFVEIQDLAAQMWNQPIKPTCHHKTRKDQLWISPEMIPYLIGVTVDATVFPDHATLVAEFKPFGPSPSCPIWSKPAALPWDEVQHDELPSESPAGCAMPQTMPEIFACLEDQVDLHLRQTSKPGLISKQRGRLTTVKPSWCKHPICPNKASRKNEVQLMYLGENFTHTKWCRQLRRLQSLVHIMQSPKDEPHVHAHRSQLWDSIKGAAGFPGGFPNAWKQRSSITPGTPLHLPKQLPTRQQVEAIFNDFRTEFQLLERALIKERCKQAKATRRENVNAIYRDVAKPRSLPVSTVVVKTNAEVVDVSVDGLTVKYHPNALCIDSPVDAEHGPLQISEHTPGTIVLSAPQAVEPGDALSQPKMLGDLNQVFQAFVNLWQPMWTKHQDTPVSRWDPVIAQIQQHVVTPPHDLVLAPITIEQWMQAVRKKKSTSAVGPDGVSKWDLQYMPRWLVHQLVKCINDLEQTATPWPQASMVGLISAIEKHSAAAAPSEYRPITVLSMIYRTYASIRTRQLLRWLHQFVHHGLKGNMPHQSTTQVWRALAEQIEHAQYFDHDWTGTVTDICKCFKTLPRHVVYFCGRHMKIPAFFMKAWMRNVSQFERRFVVTGCCSRAVYASTGFPEGDPLSVVSMVLLNHCMHCLVASSVSPIETLSYVDNWEAQSSQAHATCEAFDKMTQFAEELDIKLDTAKTHFWGTTTKSRKELKARGHQVLLHQNQHSQAYVGMVE